MQALIAFAHSRKESFTHALVAEIDHALQQKGYKVVIGDLYQLNFDPILKAEDTIHIENGEFVRSADSFPADVQVEMDYITASDLLVYVFPSWWNGMPAMMKDYVDRVFQHGFAYSFTSDELKRLFSQKQAIFFTPTGQPQALDGEDTPITSAMKAVTFGWMFNSSGTKVLDHIFYGQVPYQSSDDLAKYLADARKRILAIEPMHEIL